MYKYLLKPIFFLFPPEKAHYLTIFIFKTALTIPGVRQIIRKLYTYKHPSLEREVFGLKFSNPVGLAAGFDKDGKYFATMANLGFGFIEIGTVTPKGQAGNPQPRLFRLPADEALINRMGFNNEGVEALVSRLKKGKPEGVIIGGNIGKNKVTPNENAHEDYRICFEALFPHVHYFVVNVSSPNTPGLRELQEKEPLTKLLSLLKKLNAEKDNPKPILLKIAPDLTNEQLDDIIDIVQSTGIDGIIGTNTTISRKGLATNKKTIESIGNGGLSGVPVRARSTAVIKYLSEKSGGNIPIVAVGGIASAKDALEKLEAGASLVQVYTGLIYAGPSLIKSINKALVQKN
ncbi:MAG: quinone-dependent dihydroorotate dehydrogenase [Bacteroidota bacterium]